jgi:predicted Zn-dependent protease
LEAEAVEHALRADLIGDQAAIAVVERAGGAAMAAGALGTAAEHLRAAVRLAGDRAAPALALALGEALVVGGRPAEAIAVYERLRIRDDLDTTDRVQTLRMLGRAVFLTAGQDQATEPFAQAAALAETCGETTLAALLIGAGARLGHPGPDSFTTTGHPGVRADQDRTRAAAPPRCRGLGAGHVAHRRPSGLGGL